MTYFVVLQNSQQMFNDQLPIFNRLWIPASAGMTAVEELDSHSPLPAFAGTGPAGTGPAGMTAEDANLFVIPENA